MIYRLRFASVSTCSVSAFDEEIYIDELVLIYLLSVLDVYAVAPSPLCFHSWQTRVDDSIVIKECA